MTYYSYLKELCYKYLKKDFNIKDYKIILVEVLNNASKEELIQLKELLFTKILNDQENFER